MSGRPSLWLAQEIDAARRHRVGIIVPLLLGSDADIPEALRDLKAVRIDRPEQIDDVANGIAKRSLGPDGAGNSKRG